MNREISNAEIERSTALHSYNLINAPRERDFDDIAKMASEVCGTPIAVVNLVDTHRQFFLAEVGLGVRETPLETSFCGHAILEEDMLVIPDASQDARFDGNPLVHEDPGLRFYAGALLKSPDGQPLGTMCVLDTVPRELTGRQIEMLRFLARQAETQMELRRSLASQNRLLSESQQSAARHRQIMDSAVDVAVITLDLSGNVTSWSAGAEHVLGWTEQEMIGRPSHIFFTQDDQNDGVPEAVIANAERDGRAINERWHLRKDQSTFWASGEIMPLLDQNDRHVGYVNILRDRTMQRKAEMQREELMHELAHRMKNMLSITNAIVSQTFRTAQTLEDAQNAVSGRLIALGRAQDMLTQSKSNVTGIAQIVEDALAPHKTCDAHISMHGPVIELASEQGLGLSLALHELATNATKYGALSVPRGTVHIEWSLAPDNIFTFRWEERGGPQVALPSTRGFGSRLIERLVGPYFKGEGALTFDPSGVRFQLTGSLETPAV